MLGFKSSPAGKMDVPGLQPFKVDTQPSIQENMSSNGKSIKLDSDAIARAAAANAVAMNRNISNYQASLASPVQVSTSSRKSSLTLSKIRMRKESYNGNSHAQRRTVSSFTSGSNMRSVLESGDIVKEQYLSVKYRCQRELGAGVGLHFLDTSYGDLVHWISDERLTRIPHKGSSWDRVLISAVHFADQVRGLGLAISTFAPESDTASNLVYGQCLLLLELGHENAAALETAFTLFYQVGLEIATLLNSQRILAASPEIIENVSKSFADMLAIVGDVSIAYYTAIHRLHHSEQASTKLDYARFGHRIETFRAGVSLCAQEMWRFVLEESPEHDYDSIRDLKTWLAPQDTVMALLSADHVNLVGHADEYTCTWLQPHLNSFFKGEQKCLLIQGKAGTGKTTLANWVVNRLQRPVSRRSITTLSFFFNSSVMASETPLAMLKTLLLQLLTKYIDPNLLPPIMNAYTAHDQEAALWYALNAALENKNKNREEMLPQLAIVVDLDELEAQKTKGVQFIENLQLLADRVPGVRLILFSSPATLIHATATTTIQLSAENLADDFQAIIRHGLSKLPHFHGLDEAAQEAVVDQLISISGGSVLYASLAMRYLRLQKSDWKLGAASVGVLLNQLHTVPSLVPKILTAMHLDHDGKVLISLLVAAERPLSREEIGILLQAQTQQGGLSDTRVNVDIVIKSVAPFIMTGESLVTLRHRDIKDALVAIPDSSSASLQLGTRHQDLLMRLFICAKSHLHSQDDHEPTLSFLNQEQVDTRLASHRILEYAARYWPVHFRKAPGLYKAEGSLALPKDFKSVFPKSIGFITLEAGAWRHQYSTRETLNLLTLAYRVRHAVFGEHHTCVLQSALICALFCDTAASRPIDAVEWYFKASKIGCVVLGQQAELVITCCTTILRLSASLISKTRTTTTTYREQTLIVLISVYKHRYGESSTEVIGLYNALVELYVTIGEEEKSIEILVKIKAIQTGHDQDGHDHDHHDHPSRGPKHRPGHDHGPHGHRDVTITRKDPCKVKNYEDIFRFCSHGDDSEDSWTITLVEEMILIAVKLVAEKNYARSEEIFLELWLRLDTQCRGSQVLEWHQKRILVTLKYVEVLHIQGRYEEASALLLSCWAEYSIHMISTYESIIVQLQEIAVWMQRLDMCSVALIVFQKCHSWYKSSHMEQTTSFKKIEEHIAVTSREIVKSSSKVSTTSVSESSETVMREVFESTFSCTETTETTDVSSTTLELCESLTTIYLKEEKWSQAVAVIKQTLMKSSFSFFFSESLSYEKIDVKSTSTSKHISLIKKLAECYVHQNRFEKVEYLYLRLYRLHHKCCTRLDIDLVIEYTDLYVNFLRKHDMFNQLICFYQELLVDYRSCDGRTHERTISVLYILGDLCKERHVQYGYYIDYYVEIVTNLNQGALICHENAFRALLIVADHYYQCQRYSESLVYFRSIIATFCKFGTKFKHLEDVTVIQQILVKYYTVIEETQIEIAEHVSILKEIRTACIQFFGEESSISIEVTLSLADVCQRSETYQYEAMSFYEHILKHSKTVSKTVTSRSQSSLKSLYIKQVTSSTSSKTVTKEVIEKATVMSHARYIEIRKTQSVTSHATLTQLEELVTLYHKQSKTECAVTELRSLIVECFSKTTSAQALIQTAKHLASIYTSCGYVSHAQTLIWELRKQLIYNTRSEGCGFNLTKFDIRNYSAFIASLEWSIRIHSSLTLASFMAELLAESLYYGRLRSSIEAKAPLHVVLMHAARLRSMLFRLHRSKDFEFVEAETVRYFTSVEPLVVKSSSGASIRIFVVLLLSHFSTRQQQLDHATMTSQAGHAAVRELRYLLKQNKHKEAVELARCTYEFLKVHEGLDDPREISLGFQLCLLMAGRGVHEEHGQANGKTTDDKYHRHDQPLSKEMIDLSRTILVEVLKICETHNINLIRCQWHEINDLISLLGELKEFSQLQWLLTNLWESREGQSTWGQDVKLALGARLAEVTFLNASRSNDNSDAKRKAAIRLIEDLAYNVRRVHGVRHRQTLQIMKLQAELCTSTALHYQAAAGEKNRFADLAKLYFRKAAVVHEDVLKLLLDKDDDDDDGSDDGSVVSPLSDFFPHTGNNGRVASFALSRVPTGNVTHLNRSHSDHHNHHKHHQEREPYFTRTKEVTAVKTHLRLLKIALQRLGTWGVRGGVEDYQELTAKVWCEFGPELRAGGVKEEEGRAKSWRVEEFGSGKSEGGNEGAFAEPVAWGVDLEV